MAGEVTRALIMLVVKHRITMVEWVSTEYRWWNGCAQTINGGGGEHRVSMVAWVSTEYQWWNG